ncbi:MAG: mechanosensitive ion channel [Rhodospirillales bacterium]|nr:mechanosensitive ion channel [Rhodospirillales bacterium]
MQLRAIIDSLLGSQVISTIILVSAALALRFVAERYLRSRDTIDVDQKRRIRANIKNSLFFLICIGLFFIWAPALRTFALSLTAFAVAIILATKEVILCISGSLVKTASQSVRIGDWVTIGHIRGEVIDQNLISTTLQDLGTGPLAFEFTGKTTVLPNSLYLNTPVTNERFYKRFVVHSISMIVEADVDPAPVIKAMSDIIHRELTESLEVAKRYKSMIETRAGISLPAIAGEAHLLTTNEGRLRISISCFLPTKSALGIEQRALLAGLENARQQRSARNRAEKPASD